MNIQVGKAYRIYGKMADMKRYQPLGRGCFVHNLIYAVIYQVADEEYKKELELMIDDLNESNDGHFEARLVAGW